MGIKFNPFTGNLDVVGSSGSAGFTAVPLIIDSGVTYAVKDNTQVLFTNPIIVNPGGVLLSEGTGVLVGVERSNGISIVIATAPLTNEGTQGSMTFVKGVLTAQIQAT